MAKMTKKMEMFCLEYLKDFNATQAARRSGYSERTAKQAGTDNLAKPIISERIAKLVEQRAITVKVDANYVLHRLKEIDELDILDIITDDMKAFKPLSEWPRSWRISISAMDIKKIITYEDDQPIESLIQKIKWPDKLKNLEVLGRHVSVRAFESVSNDDEIGESLNITFGVADSVADIRVTRGA